MSISKAELLSAISYAASREFEEIPEESEIDYTFSKNFENKMNRLISAQKRYLWNCTNTAWKRVAIIVASLFILLIGSMSVNAVRKPFIEFVTKIFSDHNEYTIKGNTRDEISYKYTLGYIPEGFVQTNHIEYNLMICYEYENSAKDYISFVQSTSENFMMAMDNEHGEIYKIKLRDTDIQVYEAEDSILAFWVEEGYVFEITYYNGNLDTLKQMILSVK